METRIAIMLGIWAFFLFFGGLFRMADNDLTSYRRTSPLPWYGHGEIYMALGVLFGSVIPFFVPS